MKKIGIAVDNHKLEYYKAKLTEAGFRGFNITQLTKSCKFIAIYVTNAEFSKAQKTIHKLCNLAEIYFKQRN